MLDTLLDTRCDSSRRPQLVLRTTKRRIETGLVCRHDNRRLGKRRLLFSEDVMITNAEIDQGMGT